ncbi:hypothetical protein N7540_004095 [Penicillium herquei]|nr:hypothetical protein N7540_004095 [Penicillium herquei]
MTLYWHYTHGFCQPQQGGDSQNSRKLGDIVHKWIRSEIYGGNSAQDTGNVVMLEEAFHIDGCALIDKTLIAKIATFSNAQHFEITVSLAWV